MTPGSALAMGKAFADIWRIIYPECAEPGAEGLGRGTALRSSIEGDNAAIAELCNEVESVGSGERRFADCPEDSLNGRGLGDTPLYGKMGGACFPVAVSPYPVKPRLEIESSTCALRVRRSAK